MVSLARRFIARQRRWSEQFDRLLPEKYQVDGNTDFKTRVVPCYLRPKTIIYDVGGGRTPHVMLQTKHCYDLMIVGIDIDQRELDEAPPGSYDRTIRADVTTFKGDGEADLVICEATLEHIEDTEAAFAALSTLPKPGGRIAIFVPCRNALYARLNRLLPESLKRLLLFSIFPEAAQRNDGFKAYYNKCTPKDFRRMALAHGMEVELEKCYFLSGYFGFFAPLYVVWRLWVLGFHALAGDQAAESFVVVLRRSGQARSDGYDALGSEFGRTSWIRKMIDHTAQPPGCSTKGRMTGAAVWRRDTPAARIEPAGGARRVGRPALGGASFGSPRI